jgi:hypothetical protein
MLEAMMNSQEFDILSREIEALKQQLASGITVPQKFDRLNKTTTWTGDTTDLIVGTIVTWTGTAWEAADQDTLNPEDQIGVVISQSSTRITVVLWGNFILDPADVDDQTAYYLDPDNPGEFTDTPADTLVFRCAENGECFIATAGGGGLPDAADGTVFGQIPKTGTPPNEEHGIPEALSTPELGTTADGGGSLKVFTDAGKKIQTGSGAILQADRSGAVFDFTHVSVITTTTTAPTGSGVKGQMHMIY